uniref:photosystem I assembly protein Ycf4 n=1 Tax=Phacus arnoldii TaxID=298292 RepID=UPI0023AB4460|nr:photosystem I assembly protein Ycf4 [Phacus arnoldii]WCH63561.1 photosystem I assembly protein Ycf4 [Phacus arnoldii]
MEIILSKEINKKNNLIRTNTIFKQEIVNEQKITDYLLSITMFLGSLGFSIVGISSYLNFNLVPFLNSKEIIFFPQGLTMCFYGIFGLILSSYQILIIYWNIGQGYNKFDKEKGTLEIFRKGFPGENSKIKLKFLIILIEAIKIENNTNIFNSKQIIFICLKEKVEIPLLQIKIPIKINEIEEKASELASFLNIPLRGA